MSKQSKFTSEASSSSSAAIAAASSAYTGSLAAMTTALAPDMKPDLAETICILRACAKLDNPDFPGHDCTNADAKCEFIDIPTTCGPASESATIRNLLNDLGNSGSPIPVAVSVPILREVVRFCELLWTHHHDVTDFSKRHLTQVAGWQIAFITPFRTNYLMMFKLIGAADYLNIQQLMQLGCFTIAQELHGKNEAQMRVIFGVTDAGFSADQLKEIEEENAWLKNLEEEAKK